MKTSSFFQLLILSICLLPLTLSAQNWGVEFSGGYEQRRITRIVDPNTFAPRPLYLRQYDVAPGVWWSKAGTRFGRARLHYGMLRGGADIFGETAYHLYRDAKMRNTTLIGGAIGGGWMGSWRKLDWRLGFEGGYVRTSARLVIFSQDPQEEVFTGIDETMSARISEVQGGCFMDLGLRLSTLISLGLEQRIAMRWMHMAGDIADTNNSYDGWGFTQVLPPQDVTWPRLWMRMSF